MSLPSLARWKTWLARMPAGKCRLGEVTLAGTIAGSAGIPWEKPRIFGQWALVYVVRGAGRYRDENGVQRLVRAGDCIVVFPEIAHAYQADPEPGWDEVYVCFRGPVFEAWREAGYLETSRPVFPGPPVEMARRLFAEFFERARETDALGAVTAWQQTLADFVGGLPRRDAAPPWLEEALAHLEKTPSEPGATLAEIAAACGMGYESFRKKFQAAMGEPPARYALSRRIARARRLLRMHDLSNQELAGLLGFSDEFHFSKTFTRFSGISPREYRRQISRK